MSFADEFVACFKATEFVEQILPPLSLFTACVVAYSFFTSHSTTKKLPNKCHFLLLFFFFFWQIWMCLMVFHQFSIITQGPQANIIFCSMIWKLNRIISCYEISAHYYTAYFISTSVQLLLSKSTQNKSKYLWIFKEYANIFWKALLLLTGKQVL